MTRHGRGVQLLALFCCFFGLAFGAMESARAAPTLSFTASPTTVASGGTSKLSWSASRPATCVASGGWSGSKSTSGNERTAALSATTTFNLTCSNSTGSTARSVTVTVVPAPTLTLTANPTSVSSGGSSTLSWSTTNATSCTASGAWSGSKATTGSQSTGALTTNATYTLACSGIGGSVSRSVTVSVSTPPPPPTASLAANPTSVAAGGSSTLTWASTNATSCTASGGWSGSKPTSGSTSTGALAASTTFTLVCSNAAGSATANVTVAVTAAAPVVTLTANPTSVASGGKATLNWTTTNATSCTASGGWTGSKPTSGSEQTAALSATTTFNLSCTGPGGSGAASTQVVVGSFAPLAVFANLADGTAIDLGIAGCTDVVGEYAGYCRQSTDYSGMVYDARNHMVLHFGGGHATTMTDTVHAIDLKTGTTWADLYTPTPCSAMTAANVDTLKGAWLSGPSGPYPRPLGTHTYGLVTFAPDQNELVLLGRKSAQGALCGQNISDNITGPVAHFNMAARSWAFSPDTTSTDIIGPIPAADFDPVSKKMIVLGRGGLILYDPATRQSSTPVIQLTTSSGAPFDTQTLLFYADHMTYFPPTDRFYYFARTGQVFELALNRANPAASKIDEIATSGPNPASLGEFGFAYDSKNGVIGGGVTGGAFYIFKPQTRTWLALTIPGGSPGDMAFHNIVYDPINNVFLFRTTYEAGQRTWAFRYKN